MEIFVGAEDYERYLTWLRQHPDGFVLDCRGEGMRTLHRASCRRSGAEPPIDETWTTTPKLCSTEREMLGPMATTECDSCSP
jgi:hypothetical protein